MTLCYKTLNQALDVNPKSLASIFILIKLCVHVENYKSEFGNIKFKRKSKDYAQIMKKADDYMGYLGWAEIYISTKEKREVGI